MFQGSNAPAETAMSRKALLMACLSKRARIGTEREGRFTRFTLRRCQRKLLYIRLTR